LPKGWVGVPNFRREVVHRLLTTSYSQHVVSTIQTRSAGPTMDRTSVTQTGLRHLGIILCCHILHLNIILSPASNFIHLIFIPVTHIPKYIDILCITSNRKLLDFYQILFKHSSANILHMLVFRSMGPRDHVTRVSINT